MRSGWSHLSSLDFGSLAKIKICVCFTSCEQVPAILTTAKPNTGSFFSPPGAHVFTETKRFLVLYKCVERTIWQKETFFDRKSPVAMTAADVPFPPSVSSDLSVFIFLERLRCHTVTIPGLFKHLAESCQLSLLSDLRSYVQTQPFLTCPTGGLSVFPCPAHLWLVFSTPLLPQLHHINNQSLCMYLLYSCGLLYSFCLFHRRHFDMSQQEQHRFK